MEFTFSEHLKNVIADVERESRERARVAMERMARAAVEDARENRLGPQTAPRGERGGERPLAPQALFTRTGALRDSVESEVRPGETRFELFAYFRSHARRNGFDYGAYWETEGLRPFLSPALEQALSRDRFEEFFEGGGNHGINAGGKIA